MRREEKREQIAESREQRAESREQLAENREKRRESQRITRKMRMMTKEDEKSNDYSAASLNLAISSIKYFYKMIMKNDIVADRKRPRQDKAVRIKSPLDTINEEDE